MSTIRILPDRVANQIAAGEVIERPAAVVKELVENSLDAGATRIEVEFRNGGRAYIRVEDNGTGMGRDDALLSLERHATSKIAEAADLDRLATFGFRGEALPSIASVSRFELLTRPSGDEAGTEILVNGGKFVHVRDCGRPVGTRLVVSHLFNSVPARRKFLKSDATESAHIIHCVRLYALACPQAAFTLIEDGRAIFRSPECTTTADRVAEIFGRQITDSLLVMEAVDAGLRLHGLIGRPGAGRATRHEMITFVNRRPVDSRTLSYALIESYHEALPKGRYPLAFLFLDIDPAAVDVNVHPAKREVRFRNEVQIRAFVIRSVLDRLRESADAAGVRPAPEKIPGERQGLAAPLAPAGVPSPAESRMAAPFPVYRPLVWRNQPLAPGAPAAPVSPAPPAPAPSEGKSPRIGWRYVGLAHEVYALFETDAGLVLLDRRAAHERIWYERLRQQFASGQVGTQRLLLPVPVELDAITTALLLDRLSFLQGHGFEISEFGRNFFRVEGVPEWMDPADAESFLRDLLGALREGLVAAKDLDLARDELARLASVRAVRMPEGTGEEEMTALVTQLFACQQPLTNPTGRPTFIELSHSELARRFQK
ncbi:MAG TPA: DNA mismatch repair endonuclease MutL [Opitutaceae bacterium]|nr:DNA mismatch repair endonuclease MutL [Opitutaceae bacterium]